MYGDNLQRVDLIYVFTSLCDASASCVDKKYIPICKFIFFKFKSHNFSSDFLK